MIHMLRKTLVDTFEMRLSIRVHDERPGDLDDSSQVSMWTKTETEERRHIKALQLGGC